MYRYSQTGQRSHLQVQAGFSLPEMVITLLVMAILLSLAGPSFNRVIRESRLTAATNNLVAGINTARAEAVRRGRMVSICPSADGLACTADWSLGWMVYVEKDTVNKGDAPSVDTVLQIGEATKKTVATSANTYVRFTPRGLVEAAVVVRISPEQCNTGFSQREVSVGAAGRAGVSKTTCP